MEIFQEGQLTIEVQMARLHHGVRFILIEDSSGTTDSYGHILIPVLLPNLRNFEGIF